MRIREAVIDDFDRIDALYEQVDKLHRDAHPEIYVNPVTPVRTVERISSIIQDDLIKLNVLELNGEVIGLARGEIMTSSDVALYKKRAWLLVGIIVVDDKYRGKGYGQNLLDSLYSWAKEKEIQEVELTVYSFNKEAIRFYETNGFSKISQKMKRNIIS